MIGKLFSVIGFSFIAVTSFCQQEYSTENATHVFWQPNVKLAFESYQGKLTPDLDSLMSEYHFSASASVGIWGVLDIPDKKKDRYHKSEKVYFAPAFDKTTSFARTDDSCQLEMQTLFFDICEVWARWARKELQTLVDSSKATGTPSMWYMTVKKRMNDNRLTMFRAYFKDVFVDKKDHSFVQWRQEIDKSLQESEKWTTTPKECYRLMTQKPVEQGYIKAPMVVGVLDK